MDFGFIQPVLILIFIGIISILLAIIKSRFEFNLKNQRKWFLGLIIVFLFSLLSSILNFSYQWKVIYDNLQLFTLSTIFSAIAAIGVIVQISRSPLVFTTVDLWLTTNKIGVQISENAETTITLFVYNCSKVTATDIYVKAKFPSEVEVLNIDTPMWSKLKDSGFEVNFNVNGYNPLHPFVKTSFDVKIKSEKIASFKPVIITTMVENMKPSHHSFFIETKDFDSGMSHISKIEDSEIENNLNLSFENTRERYFFFQKVFTVILLILGITSWVESLLKNIPNIISLIMSFV